MTYIPTEEHIAMWNRGWSSRNIAERAGVHRMTVERGFARVGIKTGRRRNPQVVIAIEEARKMRAAGAKIPQIVDRLGYCRRAIQRWLNQ